MDVYGCIGIGGRGIPATHCNARLIRCEWITRQESRQVQARVQARAQARAPL